LKKGDKRSPPKKESNRANPDLCDTPEKANDEFEIIVEDEYDSISLDGI